MSVLSNEILEKLVDVSHLAVGQTMHICVDYRFVSPIRSHVKRAYNSKGKFISTCYRMDSKRLFFTRCE